MAKTILKRLMRQIQRRIDRDSEDQESSLEVSNTFKLFGESIPEAIAEVESLDSREYAWMESAAPEFDAEDHEVVIYWLPLDTCIVRISSNHLLQPQVNKFRKKKKKNTDTFFTPRSVGVVSKFRFVRR